MIGMVSGEVRSGEPQRLGRIKKSVDYSIITLGQGREVRPRVGGFWEDGTRVRVFALVLLAKVKSVIYPEYRREPIRSAT